MRLGSFVFLLDNLFRCVDPDCFGNDWRLGMPPTNRSGVFAQALWSVRFRALVISSA